MRVRAADRPADELVGVLKRRLKAAGVRHFSVAADGDAARIAFRPEDDRRVRLVLVSGRLTLAWGDAPPFVDGPVPRGATCVQSLAWDGADLALRLGAEVGERLEAETALHVGEALSISLDGELLVAPTVLEPITHGALMVPVHGFTALPCPAIRARLLGGPLDGLTVE